MKLIKASLIACMLSFSGGSAHAQGAPCCDRGEVNVGASALLWRVGACDTLFCDTGVLTFPVGPPQFQDVNYHYIDTGWDWGVRVFAAVDTGCYWGEVDYLWYEASGSATARPPGPSREFDFYQYAQINGAPGNWERVDASARVRYQHATLSVGLPFCCTSCCRVDGVALARYLDLDMRMRISAVDPTVVAEVEVFNPDPPPDFFLVPAVIPFPGHPGSGGADAGFTGGGAGVGLRGACALNCGFEVHGRINVFGFFGRSQTAHSAFVIDPSMNEPPIPDPPPAEPIPSQDMRFDVPGRTCWVPGLEMGVSLAYGFECGCTALKLELGWDLYYYYHALHETTAEPLNSYTNVQIGGGGKNTAQLKNSQFNTIAFGGPTFSVRAEF